jgi:hypothetical protein
METDVTVPQDISYQKELHISWRKPEGDKKLVILNLNEGDLFSLEDPSSIKIWEDLMAGKTVGGIIEELSRQYAEEDPAVVARTTDEFVADLTQNKLICPRPKSAVLN